MKRLWQCAGAAVIAASVCGCAKQDKAEQGQSNHSPKAYAYLAATTRNNVSASADDSTWQPVTVGDTLASGAWVETGRKSLARLDGTLGDIVVIGERAKVRLLVGELSRHAGAAPSRLSRGVELLRGLARFDIKKSPQTFQVETPSASVRVKGTSFAVSFDTRSGHTDVRVEEGEVEIVDKNSPDRVMRARERQAVTGVGSGSATTRELTPEDTLLMNDLVGWTSTAAAVLPGKEHTDSVHRRLSRESAPARGRATATEHSSSRKELDRERQATREAMDSVRTDFAGHKSHQRASLEETKAEARAELETERKTAGKRLEEERSDLSAEAEATRKELEAERSRLQTGNRASEGENDPFEELRRRKARANQ